MSFFIKINGWSGNDKGGASKKFAKVFRLNSDEADSAMGQISNGLPWQFEHTVSDKQGEQAQNYLQQSGFDVELASPSDIESMDGLDSFTSSDSQDYSEHEEAGNIPGAAQSNAKPKSSKTGILVLLFIVLAGVGLTQTQFGKDLLDKVITMSKELIGGFSSDPVAMHKTKPVSVNTGQAQETINTNNVTQKGQSMIDATLKETKQDFKGAESIYTQVIAMNPDDPAAYIKRGNARKNMEMKKEGTKDLEKGLNIVLDAITKDPENPELYYLKATAMGHLSNFDAAIEAMKKAIKLKPGEKTYEFGLTALEMQKKFAMVAGS